MPPISHPRLTRALKAIIVLAFFAAVMVVSLPSEHSRPPERIVTTSIARPINPTALPESVASTTTTTTEPPATTTSAPRATKSVTATDDVAVPSGDVLAAIAKHFPDLYDQAVGVARCESTLNPGAVSGPNYGLFQINRVHRARVEAMGFTWSQILDADVNATVARAIYDEQGWGPWACRWAAG